MADKEIKVGFEEVKLEALEFFLRENSTTVETVLKDHLDKVYEKQVPQQVRKYVERNINTQAEEQQNNVAVQEPVARQPRRRRGQNADRANALISENHGEPNTENAIEQYVDEASEAGMTMVM